MSVFHQYLHTFKSLLAHNTSLCPKPHAFLHLWPYLTPPKKSFLKSRLHFISPRACPQFTILLISVLFLPPEESQKLLSVKSPMTHMVTESSEFSLPVSWPHSISSLIPKTPSPQVCFSLWSIWHTATRQIILKMQIWWCLFSCLKLFKALHCLQDKNQTLFHCNQTLWA